MYFYYQGFLEALPVQSCQFHSLQVQNELIKFLNKSIDDKSTALASKLFQLLIECTVKKSCDLHTLLACGLYILNL